MSNRTANATRNGSTNSNGGVDVAELQRKLAALEAENAKLKTPTPLRMKVSEKGAISLYGLQSRFPVTLYAKQWERIADHMPTILQFIKDNETALSRKD
jgi:hypothetical protein